MVAAVGPTIHVVRDPDELAERVGSRIGELAHAAFRRERGFRLALSGGSTPLPLFRWFAGAGSSAIPWEAVHLYWCDERCVPPEHPASNYGSAFRAFLSDVPIPSKNVHRMLGELTPPRDAADAYEETLRATAASASDAAGPPELDLALLGIGPDGHTASLFPGRPSLESGRWVEVEADPPLDPKVPRLTLTLRALGGSERVFLLATGAEKRGIVRRVVLPGPPPVVPAGRIRSRTELAVYLDGAAAEGLPTAPSPPPEPSAP
ncbi:MAG TPA: 6-phosphogluconolactonase [Thermoplasmata archaeon]|nr:6-phosphogluconolactonase [Thermoplasmata archaeon]